MFLLIWLLTPAFAAQPNAVIERLLTAENIRGAQAKCNKWLASATDAAPSLREACAQAFWHQARLEGTVAGWKRYAKTWEGTQQVTPAHEMEAHQALLLLEMNASADALLAVASAYPGTKAAKKAQARGANTLFLHVTSSEDAQLFCAKFPHDPRRTDLVQRYLHGFITLSFDDAGPRATLTGCAKDVGLPKPALHPVMKLNDGRLVSWDHTVRNLLLTVGLDESDINGLSGEASFPRCFDPRLPKDATLGVQVSSGKGSTFFSTPFDPSCDDQAAPIVFSLKGGSFSGLSFGPRHRLELPDPKADSLLYPWQPRQTVLTKTALVQPLQDSLSVIHPLSGGAAYWLVDSPKKPLAASPAANWSSSPLWGDWTLASAGSARSLQNKSALQWLLPSGAPLVLSPLLQRLTNFPPERALMGSTQPSSLPHVGWRWPTEGSDQGGPTNSTPVDLFPIGRYTLANAADSLLRLGLNIEPIAGWGVQLDDDEVLETGLLARWDGKAVRFILDPSEHDGLRVYPTLLDDTALPSPESPATAFAFSREGRSYIAFRAPNGINVEVFHFEQGDLEAEQLAAPIY